MSFRLGSNAGAAPARPLRAQTVQVFVGIGLGVDLLSRAFSQFSSLYLANSVHAAWMLPLEKVRLFTQDEV
ncbi:MAG TPA: hypothetical protein DDY14_01910 [Chromatiaceae bacterium]|nr:hypothetical protein [Chromatiaceae bacterium]HCS92415.1 hypothetical protein [Chromatiaceae bacterium]